MPAPPPVDPSEPRTASATSESTPQVPEPPDAERSDPEHAVARELVALGMGALGERMGIEILEMSARRTVARMPVAGNTQPLGLLHGGASAVLAESIGSIASTLHAGPGRLALGIELSCSHHKAMRSGYVIGTATPLALGRSVASYAISITDEGGQAVCSARLTCLLRDR